MQAIQSFLRQPPPPPPPPPPFNDFNPLLISFGVCFAFPLACFVLTPADRSTAAPPSALKATAKTANGKHVPKDVVRRKAAKQSRKAADRVSLLAFWCVLILPHVWLICTQTGPTVQEQLSEWGRLTWAHLSDGPATISFQLATALLFIERMCYTWVHSFTWAFVRFCGTRAGRALGDEPMDVVLTLFLINKIIQIGTFLGMYLLMINWDAPSYIGPLEAISTFPWADRTRFQWVCLAQGLVVGQGLNTAIYKAIGKSGVYYGHRLGKPIPWVTGFPFNMGVPHPQYFGVCCSIVGFNIFAATPTHVASGWLSLTAVQLLFYVYMALVEDYL